MTDDLPPGVQRRTFRQAEHLDRITSSEGVEYVVLESVTDGKQLVHADVVEYEGRLDHPATTGAVGFAVVLSSFLAPMIAAYLVATTLDGVLGLATIAAGVVGGFVLSNLTLAYTTVGDWLYRFLEWNEHKYTIMVRGREGGETA